MNIHFNRRELQVECERIARIQQNLPLTSCSYVFKNALEVRQEDISLLTDCQLHDSISFYYNSVYSFLQGLKSLIGKSYSWSAIQFYYSVFYSCKSILGYNGIGIIRKDGLCTIKIKVGEKAKPLNRDNDHKQTIKCFINTFPDSYILSNTINSQNFFEWIQDAREITNYRQQIFQEPGSLSFLASIIDRLNRGEIISVLLDKFSSDWSLYCFQEETALIAGSYRLLFEVYNFYISQTERVSVDKKQELKRIVNDLQLKNLRFPIVDY